MYINTHTCIHVHVVWIQYKKHYYSLLTFTMTSKLGSNDFACNTCMCLVITVVRN